MTIYLELGATSILKASVMRGWSRSYIKAGPNAAWHEMYVEGNHVINFCLWNSYASNYRSLRKWLDDWLLTTIEKYCQDNKTRRYCIVVCFPLTLHTYQVSCTAPWKSFVFLYLVRVTLYQRNISLLFTQLNKYRSSTTFIRVAKSCNSSIAKCPTSHSGAPHSRKFEAFGKIEKYRSWHSSFLIGAIGVCCKTNSSNEKQSSSPIRGAN